MSFDADLFVGIDPCGARKPFTYAALDKNGRLVMLGAGEVEDVLAYAGSQRALLAAVNSPVRPNMGLVSGRVEAGQLPALRELARNLNMRRVEFELHERGINVAHTPARRELCATWAQLGFELYRRLERLGFRPRLNEPLELSWIETQPHAIYCALLGQLPLARSTLEGRLQRQLALYETGLGIRDPMNFFEELTRHKLLKGNLPLEELYTPEQLDALAAACTAWIFSRHPERSCRLGDPAEGQILLPVAGLKEKYTPGGG